MAKHRSTVCVEVCVDDLAAAKAAETAGANSVEICADLPDGGTTPSLGTVELARRRIRVPLHVMIRPRGGNYTYDDDELAVMLRDIRASQDARATGIVFGLLDRHGQIDLPRCRVLVDFARPLRVSFGRAFDLTPDPEAALEAVIEAGFHRVITSGRHEGAWEGRELLDQLVRQARGRVEVVAAGGLDEVLAPAIVQATRVTAVQVGLGVYAEASPFVGDDSTPTTSSASRCSHRELDSLKVRTLVDNLSSGLARRP